MRSVGDLVASGILLGGLFRTGHAIRPPFEDDPHTVGMTLQRLLDFGVERFYVGHGGPMAADEVRRHAQNPHETSSIKCVQKTMANKAVNRTLEAARRLGC